MTVFNLGSINIDHLYRVDHFVRPGETLASTDYRTVLGGKGANQSIALARAGAQTQHIGAIGKGDVWVLEQLRDAGVSTDHIAQLDDASGHAIIQLTSAAENSILLYPGANHQLSNEQIDTALSNANKGDWLLLQHETNALAEAMEKAAARGLHIAFNPAPMVADAVKPLLPKIDLLIVNEVEAMDLTGTDSVADAEAVLQRDYPQLRILLTLGSAGVVHISPDGRISVPAYNVDAVDTTAAGDTFIGYCLAALADGQAVSDALRRGNAAAAVCVTRLGASVSIPNTAEVDAFLSEHQD
ncbi:ribokinase [Saccharospirillum sp. MSK14-1]|uniref:ribokinase n=1 Tax=Saccharospirillum sp. MSK14-1 TaxID=1897632 RepID=UPI000D36D726|nr:ribokinase [Saccharospirillum sp. MSK14-1]PTY36159.1 ribokinase [Saccharospirillum sp. MSK14-1]